MSDRQILRNLQLPPDKESLFGTYSHDTVVVILNLLTILKVTLTIGIVSGRTVS